MEVNASYFTLYPIHINASRSLGDGRKYSRNCSVPNPTFKEIKIALDSLELHYKEHALKRHPKDLVERGRFSISKLDSKREVVQRITSMIGENREKRTQGNTKLKGNNFLNLVPASRKKSKKK